MDFLRFTIPKSDHNVFGKEVSHEITQNLGIKNVKVIKGVRYALKNVPETLLQSLNAGILGEKPVNNVITTEDIQKKYETTHFILAITPKKGQFDARANATVQAIKLLNAEIQASVATADIYLIENNINKADIEQIEAYLVNPLEEESVNPFTLPDFTDPITNLEEKFTEESQEIPNFTNFNEQQQKDLHKKLGLAMEMDDLKAIQAHFKEKNRNPNKSELLILDMYWSDHCRHTTFTTEITQLSIGGQNIVQNGDIVPFQPQNEYEKEIYETTKAFLNAKTNLKRDHKPFSLMELATIAAKQLKKDGSLNDLEESEEINAASIEINVEMENGTEETYLFMFKNETHNHPTEIAPFGGASTALGGCIRDPLSGRSYVFMGMRYVGSANPIEDVKKTLKGKLSQRQINVQATDGFASYGNQMGVPCLENTMVIHEGYKAKRFCCGVTGSATKKNEVLRGTPEINDIILALGGRTGRDGIGGATGSSKSTDNSTLTTAGAEVQKGNPPVERALQRLFDMPEFKKHIKRCNDFGAGGVTNAVGELADGIAIDLEGMPTKYAGLSPLETALAESQERMAVVIAPEHKDLILKLAIQQNVEGVEVAKVVEKPGIHLFWHKKELASLSRQLLEEGWAKKTQNIAITELKTPTKGRFANIAGQNAIEKLKNVLKDTNTASKRSIQQRFDSCVGANSIFQPFGGQTQAAPAEAAVMKFPLEQTNTGVVMTSGFDPYLSEENPLLGGMYSVIQALAKILAVGGNPFKARLTLQNYFERLKNNPTRWAKPYLMQIGAYKAQMEFKTPAIGGKDSMSGTFQTETEEINVPPTLVTFTASRINTKNAIPNHFQAENSHIYLLPFPKTAENIPQWQKAKENWKTMQESLQRKHILSAKTIQMGGIATALFEMSVGNHIGTTISEKDIPFGLFNAEYGSIIVEVAKNTQLPEVFIKIGETNSIKQIKIDKNHAEITELQEIWENVFEEIFPLKPQTKKEAKNEKINQKWFETREKPNVKRTTKPKFILPVILGTNCENETAKALQMAGAETEIWVFQNLNAQIMEQSLKNLGEKLKNAQGLMLSGGFSAGDEPDGSAKFYSALLMNNLVRHGIEHIIQNGMMLGVCNGFQALIKSGLLPYGKLAPQNEESATLGWNTSGHFLCQSQNHIITSIKSPWFSHYNIGETLSIPIAHGEGRFVASKTERDTLFANGQVALQYANANGQAGTSYAGNPNGSDEAIAGVTDESGRILGLMAHPERAIGNVRKNTPFTNKGLDIFKGGVDFLTK